jgi:hypothetical protein
MFRSPYFTKGYFGSEYWWVSPEPSVPRPSRRHPARGDRVPSTRRLPEPIGVRPARPEREHRREPEPILVSGTDKVHASALDTVKHGATDKTRLAADELAPKNKTNKTSSKQATDTVERKVVD